MSSAIKSATTVDEKVGERENVTVTLDTSKLTNFTGVPSTITTETEDVAEQ